MAPDGWRATRLGALVTMRRGISYSGNQVADDPPGVPILNLKTFLPGGGYRGHGLKFFRAGHDQRFVLAAGQVVVANTELTKAGDIIGAPALVPMSGGPYLHTHHVTRVDAIEEVLPRFLFYALCGSGAREHARAHSSGTTVLGVSTESLAATHLLLPPLAEQRKIAAILSSVDETIEKTEAVIAQLDVVKKAMLEELLTRGIPGRHSRFKQTEIGEVPNEWSVVTLRDVVDEKRPITYGIVQPGAHDPEGVLLIRGQDYIGRWRDPATYFRVARDLHEKFKRSRVGAGDVLLCIVGATTGATNIVPPFVSEANITQTTARVTPSQSKALPGFVRCYLESALGQGQVRKFIKGSAQPGLNLGDVEKFLCPLPSLAEQRRIVDAVTSVDARLDAEREYLESQRATKAALSEVLLRGELQVSS